LIEKNVNSAIGNLQIGTSKAYAKIRQWTDHIINHFWHCCEVSRDGVTTDEEAEAVLKVNITSFLCKVLSS